MPIFAEATALAIQLLEAPVAILTTIAGTGYKIGSIAQFTIRISWIGVLPRSDR
jgi:hypothetical protein